jgi:hypothetical protein
MNSSEAVLAGHEEDSMPRFLALLAASGILVGCGMSSGRFSVGDSLTVDVGASPGATAVQVKVGPRSCGPHRSSSVTVSWSDVSARVSAC